MPTGSLRVFELARRLNVTSKQILEWSAELTNDGPTSAQSRLDPALVDALTTRAHNPLDPSHKQAGARLISDAFQQARDAGKPEHMTVAVLKNRILALTGRTFTESDWGVGTFGDFLGLYPDLVDVDASSRPAVVHLRGDVAERQPAQPKLPDSWTGPRLRIRGDLWRAIVDLKGNSVYVWREGEAVALDPSERPSKWPRLPTATSADMSSWRSDFAERMTQSPRWADAAASLARWIEHGSSQGLPQPLRAEWMADLKHQVQGRLEAWFREQGLEMPSDLVESTVIHQASDSDLDGLRRLVIRAVESMSRTELEDVRLPARAWLRVKP